MSSKESVFKGALLIAGTTIGGGMLALPVLTSLGGFIPSLVIYFACWLFMALTGLLILEVNLWMEKDANLVSMAYRTLGISGKIAAWILYLFLFYCLTLAYVVGCGKLMNEFFGGILPFWLSPIIFVILFAPIAYAGATFAGRVNVFLMIGLGVFYFMFVVLGWRYVKFDLLMERNWLYSLRALPIAFTAFAYQGTLPTLVSYFHRDANKIKKAILIGSFIPFVTYVIWQWLILGIIPTYGAGGLAEALEQGDTAVEPLKQWIQNPSVYWVGQCFAFFALVTSFLGVSLGMIDFLADGLNLPKNTKGKLLISLLIFVPVLLFAYAHPHVFLEALDYAGGYGTALLLGLMPVLMVWSGRYKLGLSASYSVPGGRLLLILLGLFVIFEVLIETAHRFGAFAFLDYAA